MFTAGTVFSQSGTLTGYISDSTSGEWLQGAAVQIKGTHYGTISNLNGQYTLIGIPAGTHTVQFSFIGYFPVEREFNIARGSTYTLDIEMAPMVYQGEEVIITAQARGQVAAINQQLNSKAIVNVISTERMKEIPDMNVADAIARLPGITVQRDGGEGQKVIIRGFEPKYNTISINGLMAPSTDLDNRSTDLNMVTADIISGVEVMKANTADKDADGLGGNVNLVLKEATPGMKLSADIQTGYSGQTNSLGHYKGTLFFSNRFFNEKLGLLVSASAESYDRSSDQWQNDYDVSGIPDTAAGEYFIKPWLDDEELQSNIEIRQRYNSSVFFDFKAENSIFKLSSLFSGLSRDYFIRQKNYDLGSKYIEYQQSDVDQKGYIFSLAAEGKHTLRNMTVDWGVGNSKAQQNQPYNHRMIFRQLSAYEGNPDVFNTLPPEVIVTDAYVNEAIEEFYLYDARFQRFKAPESEFNAWGNVDIPFNITADIKGTLKFGAKYRMKNKEKNTENYTGRFDYPNEVAYVNSVYPGLEPSAHQNAIGITSFIDQDFRTTDFLNGVQPTLDVNYALRRDMISTFYELVGKPHYDTVPTGHVKFDYTGYENIQAYYVMPTINFGDAVTFIPGLRYERTYVRYKAFNGDAVPDDELSVVVNLPVTDTTTSNEYGNWLPQVHLKIKPASWIDLRLAYTVTLSRPDYNDLAPRMQISSNSLSIKHSGTYLKPVVSTNYDAIISLYPKRLGLFTVGLFHKEVHGFIYSRKANLTRGTEMDPSNFGLPDSYAGYLMTYPRNNPDVSKINGFETEIQTNMAFLRPPFNGIVFNANFTYMDSKTRYQETLVQRALNPNYGQPGEPRIIFVNYDTSYVDRMLRQATYLANVSIGYDYKGFSARLSFSYTDHILTREQRRTDGADREGTLAFYKWDFQVKQRIWKDLTIFGNVANLFNQPDRSVRLITGYYSSVEYYGLIANIGLKYKFF